MHIKECERKNFIYGEIYNGRINILKTKKYSHDKRQIVSAVFILMLAILTILSSCSSNNVKGENGKITVYTSFYTMYDFALKIGGDKVNVVNMIPSGMGPTIGSQAPGILQFIRGDLFIYNGAGMEGWVDKM